MSSAITLIDDGSSRVNPDLIESSTMYYALTEPKYLTKEVFKTYTNTEPSFKDLGVVVYLRTYSRFIPDLFKLDYKLAKDFNLHRRERWCETVLRVVEYSLSLDTVSTFEDKCVEATKLYDHIYNLRIFPSGRTLWIGGTESVKKDASANFNCSFTALESIIDYADAFYLLMIGAGVGFSIEKKYTSKLPRLNTLADTNVVLNPINTLPKEERKEDTSISIYATTVLSDDYILTDSTTFIDMESGTEYLAGGLKLDSDRKYEINIEIGDSKTGWVLGFAAFLTALSYKNIIDVTVDFDNVRSQGEILKTFGGRSSGPEPLRGLFKKTWWLSNYYEGDFTIEGSLFALDLITCIASIVACGGVRRSSLIALGDSDNQDFIDCKKGLFSYDNQEQVTKLESELAEYGYDMWEVGIPLAQAIIQQIDSLDSKYRYRQTRTMSNNSLNCWDKLSLDEIYNMFEGVKVNGEPAVISSDIAVERKNTFSTRPTEEINKYPHSGVNPCCFTGDTYVMTKKGHYQIEGILDTNVEIWNGDNWETTQFTATRYDEPVFTITLHNGQTITATAYHRFLV